MEVGSVIARLQADLKSFEDGFARASRVFAQFKHDVERQAIKGSLDDRGLADVRRAMATRRQDLSPRAD